MKRFVYADNAATTKIAPEVLDAMMPWLTEGYGNASSIYKKGREARLAMENARHQIEKALGVKESRPDYGVEIYFTSGGSEADNWAIKGAAKLMAPKGKKHIITTVFEHHAVLHTCAALEKEGFEVTYLPVDKDGLVTAQQVEDAIREDTALVTIMYANNEIGTVQPIAEIGAVCKKHGVLFHTDAVQAIGNVEINVEEQNIDMLSLSGHKIHAQKGIGVLYCRKGLRLPNLIDGGAQERSRRAGTENIAAIVGLGKAMEMACADIPARQKKLSAMRDKLIEGISKMEKVHLNGHAEKRLPGNVNFSFEGVEGEALLLTLDANGICASSGSACTSGSLDPSHVLLSIGLVHEVAHGSLRLTFSDYNTMEDVDYILEVLPGVIDRLRMMSPLWEKIKNA
ncbi:MAG: cysteine desulfurase NifS [Oscillospiraceae bacterium]|nr:cysteine desulfurase NifS [Oscillospiraceae bacterium]MBR2636724.1 cysteine desulfurase NifS [Oscillospiraceae bacterium]